MSTDDILLEAEMSMEKSVDYMVHEFAAVRTGKASPGFGGERRCACLRIGHETQTARLDHDA